MRETKIKGKVYRYDAREQKMVEMRKVAEIETPPGPVDDVYYDVEELKEIGDGTRGTEGKISELHGKD